MSNKIYRLATITTLTVCGLVLCASPISGWLGNKNLKTLSVVSTKKCPEPGKCYCTSARMEGKNHTVRCMSDGKKKGEVSKFTDDEEGTLPESYCLQNCLSSNVGMNALKDPKVRAQLAKEGKLR